MSSHRAILSALVIARKTVKRYLLVQFRPLEYTTGPAVAHSGMSIHVIFVNVSLISIFTKLRIR